MTTNEVAEHKWYSFNIWAVLAGAVTDVVSSNLTTGCYAVIATVTAVKPLLDQGLSPQAATTQLTSQLASSPIIFVLGFLCSVLGGYVSGRLARYHEVKHALASYGVIFLFSLGLSLFIKGPQIDRAIWLQVILFVLQLVSNILGGYLAQLQRELKQPKERTATT